MRALFLIFFLLSGLAHATPAELAPVLSGAKDVRTGSALPTDAKAWVLVFMGTECRLVRDYLPNLGKWAEEWKDRGVHVVGVFSHQHETAAQIQAFAEERKVAFPLVHDADQKIASLLKARHTPESFVLGEDLRVHYRGRIDDQFQFRATLPKANKEYLRNAVTAYLAGDYPKPPVTEVEGCTINLKKKPREITFTQDIGPLVFQKCTTCHREKEVAGEIFKFTTFESVSDNIETILRVVDDRVMPPWRAGPHGKFRNNFSLDANDIWMLHEWNRNGREKGFGTISPPPPPKAGFRHGEPDAVLYMTEDPKDLFTVPAKSEEPVMPYKYFRVKTNFPEDKWLVAAEIKSLVPEVVHHVTAFMIPPEVDNEWILQSPLSRAVALRIARKKYGEMTMENFEWVFRLYGPGMRRPLHLIATYNPSEPALVYPDGYGFLLPKGAELIFEAHYTPTETPRQDRASVGLWFKEMPKEPAKQQVITRAGAFMDSIQVPPYGTLTLDRKLHFHADVKLLSLRPHMHQRGKSFTAFIEYPDARKETILHIPDYDYGWQVRYVFEKPYVIPKGGILHLENHWDNTERPGNPDPSKHLKFGLQITDEMMTSYPTYVYVNPDEAEEAERQLQNDLLNNE